MKCHVSAFSKGEFISGLFENSTSPYVISESPKRSESISLWTILMFKFSSLDPLSSYFCEPWGKGIDDHVEYSLK